MTQQVRVLIVDDSARSRKGLRALLTTSQGIEVVGEAADGLQAVRMVEQYHPDVVLMDIRMPVIDGLESTRCIKLKNPATNVIILTMYPTYHDRALAAGAVAFLVKGGSSESLLRAIRAYAPPPLSVPTKEDEERKPASCRLPCTAS